MPGNDGLSGTLPCAVLVRHMAVVSSLETPHRKPQGFGHSTTLILSLLSIHGNIGERTSKRRDSMSKAVDGWRDPGLHLQSPAPPCLSVPHARGILPLLLLLSLPLTR